MNKSQLNNHLNPIDSKMVPDLPDKQVPWQMGVHQTLQMKKVKASTAALGVINNQPGFILTGGTVTINYAFVLNGKITLNNNLILNNQLTLGGITVNSVVKEQQIPLLDAGASSGGITSFFTNNGAGTPAFIDSSRLTLNPANYAGTFLLEAVYRAGTQGQTARTFNMGLYDITGGSIVTNSIVSGTAQSGVSPAALPIVRGVTDFRSSLPAGNRDYLITYYNDSSSNFVDLYQAKLIISY